jgi:hypothetical protein
MPAICRPLAAVRAMKPHGGEAGAGTWPLAARCHGRRISRAIPKAVILARLVGRHSTIRRIASRHYSAEGSLRMCRRLPRAI